MAQPIIDNDGNMLIDTEGFWMNWQMIQEKLEKIAALPEVTQLQLVGRDFEGYKIDLDANSGHGTITYRSSTWYNGCGTDYFDFTINIEELNKPLLWFKEGFQLVIQKQIEEKHRRELDKEGAVRNQELKQLAELKAKYPNALYRLQWKE